MKVPLLDLKAQYAGIKDEVRKVMDEVCESQYFINGPRVEAFERKTADYCGTAHAIGVSSGTDALLVALMALGIGPGDAVITSPYTFFATAGCIARVGATPVFVDIDPVTFNIDPVKTRQTLEAMPKRFKTLKPKVLMPVHLFGQSTDMDALLEIAREFGLKVVEDAAQAIGAEYPGGNGVKKAGAMGDIGCYSFFPSKNLGGFGDGGMAVTNDEKLAADMRKLRDHGQDPRYYYKVIGGNFRLDALQAAVLDIKLGHLEKWHFARRRNAGLYNSAFSGTFISPPAAVYAESGIANYHIYNQYIVRVKDREKLTEKMSKANIGWAIYYPLSLHQQDCFRALGYREGDMPESEKAAKETLALPVYPELTDEMLKYVIDVMV